MYYTLFELLMCISTNILQNADSVPYDSGSQTGGPKMDPGGPQISWHFEKYRQFS